MKSIAVIEAIIPPFEKEVRFTSSSISLKLIKGLTNADQRITEDVEKFAFSITELYNHTFKVKQTSIPLLNNIISSRYWM